MNPLFDLVQEERPARPAPAKSVDRQNAQSYDLLGQMMKGVSRKR